jgi:hypothetical protein
VDILRGGGVALGLSIDSVSASGSGCSHSRRSGGRQEISSSYCHRCPLTTLERYSEARSATRPYDRPFTLRPALGCCSPQLARDREVLVGIRDESPLPVYGWIGLNVYRKSTGRGPAMM